MRHNPLSALALICLVNRSLSVVLPTWNATILDPLRRFGGAPLALNVSHVRLYRATPSIGTYNMAPMIDFYSDAIGSAIIASWKNSPRDEDQAGQRILYSQTRDGAVWTPTDGTNVLFPNVSTDSNPTALYAEPTLHINGRVYVAASAKQFCVYPDPFPAVLLLRRILAETGAFGSFGPVFWASDAVPPGFSAATAALGILTLNETDTQTQADIATLANTTLLPCAAPGSGSLKCEAVTNGSAPGSGNFEVTHYRVPGGGGDVLLYRSPADGLRHLRLMASTRTAPDAPWLGPFNTSIPDDNANLNAGVLPDGRVFVLSNAMPNAFRDPLFATTSADGWAFDRTTPVTSCELEVYASPPEQPWGCLFRYGGGSKQGGCQYPQGLALTAPGWEGLWAIFALNKEDIWVLRVPFGSL